MSQSTSDPSLKPPERLPSWVRNLPAVTGEVPVPVPSPQAMLLQQVRQQLRPLVLQHRVMLGVGGGLALVLAVLLAWPSGKKPVPVATAATPAAAAVAATPAPATTPATALAVAAPGAKPADAGERRTSAPSSKRKKSAAGAPRTARSTSATPAATKAAPKDRRPVRPAAGRG